MGVIAVTLKLLLLLESNNGTTAHKEAIGGSVGRYHLTPYTVRSLVPTLRDTSDKYINQLMLSHPIYEKALATELLEQLDKSLNRQTDNQRVALLSFGYNAGPTSMIRIKNLLNKCGTSIALHYLLQYTKAGNKHLNGLKSRRFKEATILNKDKMYYNNTAYVLDRSTCYKNFDWNISQKVIDIQFRR